MSGRISRRGSVVLATVALAACAAGCGGPGVFASRPVRLPAGFPADVPLPERATLRSARDQGWRGLSVVLEAPAGLPDLAGGFEERMRAAGWTVAERAVLEGAAYTSFRKGERSVAAGVSGAGGVSQMSLSVVERPANEWKERG